MKDEEINKIVDNMLMTPERTRHGAARVTFIDERGSLGRLLETLDGEVLMLGKSDEGIPLMLSREQAGALASVLRVFSAHGTMLPPPDAKVPPDVQFEAAILNATRLAMGKGADPGDLVFRLLDLALAGMHINGFGLDDIIDQAVKKHTCTAAKCAPFAREDPKGA